MADLISVITTKLFPFVMGLFAQAFSTITGNPLLLLPVCLSLFATCLFMAIGIIKRFGVRGASSGGRRRRRR